MTLPTCYRNPGGYTVGPILEPNEAPWPVTWEQDPAVTACGLLGHHDWQTALVRREARFEEVVRCASCHAPRCGSSTDRDPCMAVRHHRDDHVTLKGVRRPVGA